MIRCLEFNSIVDQEDKDFMCGLIPQLEEKFIQRKQYLEYYFDSCDVRLDLNQLEEITNKFRINIDNSSIIILN